MYSSSNYKNVYVEKPVFKRVPSKSRITADTWLSAAATLFMAVVLNEQINRERTMYIKSEQN